MDVLDGRYYGNGYKNLYAKITGLGDPPVVLETGLGSLSVEWEEIQRELSKHTTVISYDRGGYGESPQGAKPRTSKNIALELFNMLKNTEVPGPYILVGNSIGGLYINHFARMFPRETAGLVFVDAVTPDEPDFDKLDAPVFQERMSMKSRMKNVQKFVDMEKEEFEQKIAALLSNLYAEFPQELRNALTIYQSDQKFYETVVDEYESLEDSCSLVKTVKDFPNIPVKVLSRDYEVMIQISKQIGMPEEEARAVEDLWLRNSKSLTELSTESEFMIVKGSNHSIHLSQPAVVLEQIVDMIKKVKS